MIGKMFLAFAAVMAFAQAEAGQRLFCQVYSNNPEHPRFVPHIGIYEKTGPENAKVDFFGKAWSHWDQAPFYATQSKLSITPTGSLMVTAGHFVKKDGSASSLKMISVEIQRDLISKSFHGQIFHGEIAYLDVDGKESRYSGALRCDGGVDPEGEDTRFLVPGSLFSDFKLDLSFQENYPGPDMKTSPFPQNSMTLVQGALNEQDLDRASFAGIQTLLSKSKNKDVPRLAAVSNGYLGSNHFRQDQMSFLVEGSSVNMKFPKVSRVFYGGALGFLGNNECYFGNSTDNTEIDLYLVKDAVWSYADSVPYMFDKQAFTLQDLTSSVYFSRESLVNLLKSKYSFFFNKRPCEAGFGDRWAEIPASGPIYLKLHAGNRTINVRLIHSSELESVMAN